MDKYYNIGEDCDPRRNLTSHKVIVAPQNSSSEFSPLIVMLPLE
jgi:hypothetical protein